MAQAFFAHGVTEGNMLLLMTDDDLETEMKVPCEWDDNAFSGTCEREWLLRGLHLQSLDLDVPSSYSYAALRRLLRSLITNPVTMVMVIMGAAGMRGGYAGNKWICPGIPFGFLCVYLLLPLVRSCVMVATGTVVYGGGYICSVLWLLLAPVSCMIRLSNFMSAELLGREIYPAAWLMTSWCMNERSGCLDPDRGSAAEAELVAYLSRPNNVAQIVCGGLLCFVGVATGMTKVYEARWTQAYELARIHGRRGRTPHREPSNRAWARVQNAWRKEYRAVLSADFAVHGGDGKAWSDPSTASTASTSAIDNDGHMLWRVAQALLPRRLCGIIEQAERWRLLDRGGDWSVEEKRKLLLEWIRARHDFRHRPGAVNRGGGMCISRDRVLFSSLEELAAKSIEELGRGVNVKFVPRAADSMEGFPADESEIGDDLGGLTTEWLNLLGEAMGAGDHDGSGTTDDGCATVNPLFVQCEGGARELMLRPWPQLVTKPKAESLFQAQLQQQRATADHEDAMDSRGGGGGGGNSPAEEAEPPLPPEAAATAAAAVAAVGAQQPPRDLTPAPVLPPAPDTTADTATDRPRIRRVSHHVFRWVVDQDPASGGLVIIDPAKCVRPKGHSPVRNVSRHRSFAPARLLSDRLPLRCAV